MVTLCTVRTIGRPLLRCWAAQTRPLATAACWAVCQVWQVAYFSFHVSFVRRTVITISRE